MPDVALLEICSRMIGPTGSIPTQTASIAAVELNFDRLLAP